MIQENPRITPIQTQIPQILFLFQQAFSEIRVICVPCICTANGLFPLFSRRFSDPTADPPRRTRRG
jgi:hypothetical protein